MIDFEAIALTKHNILNLFFAVIQVNKQRRIGMDDISLVEIDVVFWWKVSEYFCNGIARRHSNII